MLSFYYLFSCMLRELAHHTYKELLDLLADRNEAAFTEIYNRFWRKLYAVSYNRLNDSSLAEDIVHDVLLSLWNHADPQTIENLESYLAVAVKFRVLRTIRNQLKENNLEQDSKYTYQTTYSTEDELEAKFFMNNLEKGIARLPENLQLIFRYSRLEHKSSREIGEIMNLSHRTVENQISKALSILRKYFKYTYILFAFFFK